jgi:hypothetical protein
MLTNASFFLPTQDEMKKEKRKKETHASPFLYFVNSDYSATTLTLISCFTSL